jgi:UDP-N-acetyl-D-glucosamine/UDP-N-acetyl-D-galactosamine dehydrogenase
MGRYIAQQAVRLLIAQGGVVKGSVVTVLGFTFKEDVPDLRNTRVIDIVRELQTYDVTVQIHDPYASPAEAEHEYGVSLTAEAALQPARVVILAVAHRAYLDAGWAQLAGRLAGGRGAVVDVKGRLDRTQVPPGIELWRL